MHNILFVDGGSHADVKKALRQWIDAYSEQLNPDLVFKIYKHGHGKHVIQADERLDNESFFYLVNYMQYPVDINYEVKIVGYTKGTGQNVLKGKELFVFISETDTKYDSVYTVTETNENYEIEFGGKITKSPENRLYQKTTFIPAEDPVILKTRKKKLAKYEEVTLEDERKIDQRLKWIFIVIIGLHTFNFLVVRPFSTDRTISFENVPFFLSIGISLWLFWDYKVLQSYKRYLICVILVVCIMIYLILLEQLKLLHLSKEKIAVALFPLILLIVQLSLRYVFIQALNKEPIVDHYQREFATTFYMILLFLIPIIITLLISGMI